MARGLLAIGVALLACVVARAAAGVTDTVVPAAAGASADPTLSPQFQLIMNQVNSQVNQALAAAPKQADAPSNGLALAAPPIVPPPTDHSDVRFLQRNKADLNLLNSLDLVTMRMAEAEPTPQALPHPTVAAYAAIALETMHRAHEAWTFLLSNIAALTKQILVEKHDLTAWVSNQHTAAVYRLHEEKERIAKLTDEQSHLQHVYQDAVAKEKSYQTQANQLIAERQLQNTPPIMPAVAAAALSDSQYEVAIGKLAHYRELALKVMETTAHAIAVREHLIAEGTNWVVKSKSILNGWRQKQTELIGLRLGASQQYVDKLKKRGETVQRIFKQAVEMHKKYLDAAHWTELSEHIARLKKEKENYSKLQSKDPYDSAKNSAFISALDLEISALEKRLADIPSDGKVTPPPGIWGVLSNFHPVYTNLYHASPDGKTLPVEVKDAGAPPSDTNAFYPFPTFKLTKTEIYPNGVPIDPTLGQWQNLPANSPLVSASAQAAIAQAKSAQPVPPFSPATSAAVQADLASSFRSTSEYASPKASSSPAPLADNAPVPPPPSAVVPTSSPAALPAAPKMPDLPEPPQLAMAAIEDM